MRLIVKAEKKRESEEQKSNAARSEERVEKGKTDSAEVRENTKEQKYRNRRELKDQQQSMYSKEWRRQRPRILKNTKTKSNESK